MTTILLKDFLRTGKFGTITVGSTKTEVFDLLGKTNNLADCGETQIIKYGWYEFFYWTETEIIFGIQNDHLQSDCINHDEMISFKSRKWTLDTWFLEENNNISFAQVIQFLNDENIRYSIEPPYSGSDIKIIRCIDSQVTLDFADEYCIVERDEKGNFKNFVEKIEDNMDNFVLNGIRLFNV